VHFNAVILTGTKHGQSLEALGYGFYGSIAKRSLQKQCKNYPKIHSQTKGEGVVAHRPPPKYAPVTVQKRQNR